jgi:hypothetical protein
MGSLHWKEIYIGQTVQWPHIFIAEVLDIQCSTCSKQKANKFALGSLTILKLRRVKQLYI